MDKENQTAHKIPLTNTNNNTQYQTPKATTKNTKTDTLLSVV